MSNWQTPFNTGITLYHAGKHALALERVSEAIKLGANRAKVFDLRARILSDEFGRHREALNDAKKANKLMPSEPHTYLRLSYILNSLGSLDLALKAVDDALNLADSLNSKHQPLIDDLAVLRAELDKNIKEKHQAESAQICHIGHLPFELLSTIFDIASIHSPDFTDPATMNGMLAGKRDPSTCIHLSHVCQHWRQAAVGTPRLWRTLVLSARRPAKKVALWAERSHGRLEELVVTSTHTDWQLRGSLGDALMDLGRLFAKPPGILRVTESANARLVSDMLETAFGSTVLFQEVDLRSNPGAVVNTMAIKPLRSLSLQYIASTIDMISINNLLFLKLIGCMLIGRPLTTHLLHLNNSVVETVIIEPYPLYNYDHFVPGEASEVNLPRVRYLDLKLPWWNPGVSKLNTPSLETLRIGNIDNACGLLSRIQCTQPKPSKGLSPPTCNLRSLRIHSSAFTALDLIRALKVVELQLQSLEISWSHPDSDLNAVVAALAGGRRKARLCPNVTDFNFSYSKVSGAPIMDLVTSRMGKEGLPIKSLVLDGCSLIMPDLIPWLECYIAWVSYDQKEFQKSCCPSRSNRLQLWLDMTDSMLRDVGGWPLPHCPSVLYKKGHQQRVNKFFPIQHIPSYIVFSYLLSLMTPSIATPSTFQEVSSAVLRAQAESKDLTVRSGGYATYATSGQFVIDLKNLNAVTIDAENRVAYVQGGCRFEQVEREAIKYGLAVPAGTVSHIGVGGLSTGGGYGWLSGEHGLTVDNILGATVVVANGDILKASATENSDLFWGIRGGGSNFGIVVEFTFKLHAQREQVYTTSLTFAGEMLPIVVQQINRWTQKQTPNEAGRLTYSVSVEGKPVVNWFGFKNADAVSGETAFKGFIDIGPLENVSGMVAYEKLNSMLDGYATPGRISHWGMHLERLDLKPFKKSFEGFTKLVTENPEAASSTVAFEFYHHDKIESVAVDATAFAHRAPVYNALITTQWEKDAFTAVAHALTRELAKTTAEAASTNLATNIGYPNYADGVAGNNKTDTYAKLAFGSNYPRMQQVKAKYDATGLFNGWFAVQPVAL